MIHLGDITKISGYTAPIVDCIIGGSPCQDLSVAGKRAGLDGERSGLYIDQVRIVKEMRERDKRNGRTGVDIRPRYMVWENVPGAFSSNKGEDFRIVLEELAKVADKDAVIPMPDKGKWTSCGCIMGDGWSIAWRVLDAQFWGVPQRRRRIALVADFGGQSAQEILFVRKSVSGDTDEGESKRKEAPSDATGGIGADDSIGCDLYNGTVTGGVAATLSSNSCVTNSRNGPYVMQSCIGVDIYNTALTGDKVCPLTAGGSGSTGTCPKVIQPAYTLKIRSGCEGGGKGALIQTDKSATLSTLQDQTLFQPVTFVKSKRAQSDTDYESWQESDTANTLNAFDTGDVRTTEAVVYALDRASFNQGKNAQFDFEVSDKGINSPLVAKGPGEVCYSVDQGGGKSACNVTEGQAPTLTCTHGGEPAVCYGINGDKAGTLDSSYYKGCGMRSGVEREVVAVPQKTRYIVRRLTPLECERLQGFPDGWTDIGEWVDSNGKRHQSSDAARYKALGNSIALPPWKWVLKRLCACYERDATMASLFSGIGGFDLLWEQLNGKGSCLWASEIEEFPIAVTKVRIGE